MIRDQQNCGCSNSIASRQVRPFVSRLLEFDNYHPSAFPMVSPDCNPARRISSRRYLRPDSWLLPHPRDLIISRSIRRANLCIRPSSVTIVHEQSAYFNPCNYPGGIADTTIWRDPTLKHRVAVPIKYTAIYSCLTDCNLFNAVWL